MTAFREWWARWIWMRVIQCPHCGDWIETRTHRSVAVSTRAVLAERWHRFADWWRDRWQLWVLCRLDLHYWVPSSRYRELRCAYCGRTLDT